MTEHKRYVIKTVADFAQVPPEKRHDCLTDFMIWLEYQSLADILTAAAPPGVAVRVVDDPDGCGPDRFVWIDDGKHVATVSLRAPDGSKETFEVDFAEPK